MARRNVPGTVFLLHLDPLFKHAWHYLGKPESSGFLKVLRRFFIGEFAELLARRLIAARLELSQFLAHQGAYRFVASYRLPAPGLSV
jgi:hypothetical protein